MGLFGVLFSTLLLSFSTASAKFQEADCEFVVTKTMIPIDKKTSHQNLCLRDYMINRDLAFHSLSETQQGSIIFVKNDKTMQFDDMLLFELPKQNGKPLENQGRLELVKLILGSFFSELKNSYGSCELKLYSDSKELTLADFKESARDADGQPGTRLMLRKDDVANPRWELICPLESGDKEVVKSGDYFFIFVDVYENTGENEKLKGHLSRFLFSLN